MEEEVMEVLLLKVLAKIVIIQIVILVKNVEILQQIQQQLLWLHKNNKMILGEALIIYLLHFLIIVKKIFLEGIYLKWSSN